MKLLIVTPYYHPKIGGLENYVYHLVHELQKDRSLQLVIITTNHTEKKYEKIQKQNVTMYRLPIQFVLSNTPTSFKWFWNIKKIIKDEKPDIINVHAPVPFIADITAFVDKKTPFILTYHAGSMKKGILLVDLMIHLYENIFLPKLLQRADKIICYSQQFIESFLSNYKHKIVSLAPGVDINFFTPSKINNKNKVLYVGKIEKSASWKGTDVLIDAIEILHKKNSDIELTLVGSGDLIEEYTERIKTKRLSNNIFFAGELKEKELVDLMHQSTLLVLPSKTNAESFGMVLIEAMACGLPVIGSAIGGIPQVIDDTINGLLVEPNNPVALAQSIEQLLQDPDQAKKMGENGRNKVVKKFTWEINANKFIQLLHEYK